jgi:chemotaxis protein CheX
MAAPKIENANPLLDKRFINAFVDGVIKTVSLMASSQCSPGKPRIEPQFKVAADVVGTVGMVAGPLKGTLAICFTKESIFKILTNMLGEAHTSISPEVADAVGELTNQIYGSAKTTLNQIGFSFDMAIPSVITGGDFTMTNMVQSATLIVPFNLDSGETFSIALTIS